MYRLNGEHVRYLVTNLVFLSMLRRKLREPVRKPEEDKKPVKSFNSWRDKQKDEPENNRSEGGSRWKSDDRPRRDDDRPRREDDRPRRDEPENSRSEGGGRWKLDDKPRRDEDRPRRDDDRPRRDDDRPRRDDDKKPDSEVSWRSRNAPSERKPFVRDSDRDADRKMFSRDSDRNAPSDRKMFSRDSDRDAPSERKIFSRDSDRDAPSGRDERSDGGLSRDKGFRRFDTDDRDKGRGAFSKGGDRRSDIVSRDFR